MPTLLEHDPNAETHRCMRCRGVEFMRNLSLIGNAYRVWVCYPCHLLLVELVGGWLAPEHKTPPGSIPHV